MLKFASNASRNADGRGPAARYEQDLKHPDFRPDPAQKNAVAELQALYEELIHSPEPATGWRAYVLRRLGRVPEPEKGLYLWGGVGRGKTYLMDSFFDSLPFDRKLRVHFHRFMRRVHADLREMTGQKNPLERVADKIASEARVVCFDEFFVSDITDAMLLGTLLKAMFERQVTLVATSNVPPRDLYRDGLQRSRFLPAIDLLERHTRVVEVNGEQDHRLRALEQAELYHSPLGEAADESLMRSFKSLMPAQADCHVDQQIDIEGRSILARYLGEDVVWFEFEQLCDGPRSQNDYIELAREYHSVVISNVPGLGRHNDDQARRFINLVDEFYDRQVKLVVSGARPLNELYGEGRLSFEFQRTASRLLEMQSHDYLARPHKP